MGTIPLHCRCDTPSTILLTKAPLDNLKLQLNVESVSVRQENHLAKPSTPPTSSRPWSKTIVSSCFTRRIDRRIQIWSGHSCIGSYDGFNASPAADADFPGSDNLLRSLLDRFFSYLVPIPSHSKPVSRSEHCFRPTRIRTKQAVTAEALGKIELTTQGSL